MRVVNVGTARTLRRCVSSNWASTRAVVRRWVFGTAVWPKNGATARNQAARSDTASATPPESPVPRLAAARAAKTPTAPSPSCPPFSSHKILRSMSNCKTFRRWRNAAVWMIFSSTTTDSAPCYIYCICYETAPNSSDCDTKLITCSPTLPMVSSPSSCPGRINIIALDFGHLASSNLLSIHSHGAN